MKSEPHLCPAPHLTTVRITTSLVAKAAIDVAREERRDQIAGGVEQNVACAAKCGHQWDLVRDARCAKVEDL
jgi:hypothetical protein